MSEIIEGVGGVTGLIIQEIRARSAGFGTCNYVHEFWSSNFEAHNLAKFATILDQGRHVWLTHPYVPVMVPENMLHDQ